MLALILRGRPQSGAASNDSQEPLADLVTRQIVLTHRNGACCGAIPRHDDVHVFTEL
jgi:hypothetical protein